MGVGRGGEASRQRAGRGWGGRRFGRRWLRGRCVSPEGGDGSMRWKAERPALAGGGEEDHRGRLR